MVRVGLLLAEGRKIHGITQKKMAAMVGCSVGTIRRLEAKERQGQVSPRTLAVAAGLLGFDVLVTLATPDRGQKVDKDGVPLWFPLGSKGREIC